MEATSVTFLLFTAFSGLRIFSYLPQIRRVASDPNGASAIAYSTWALWTGANIATALYALTNLGDLYMAFVSTVYAGCCVTVIILTMLKRNSTVWRNPAHLSGRARAHRPASNFRSDADINSCSHGIGPISTLPAGRRS